MNFRLLLKLYGVWFGAWLLGCMVNTFYCYATAKDFVFKGVNYGNHASELSIQSAVWSFPVAVIAFPLIYAPLMFGLRHILGGLKPAFAFPLVAALLYIIPAAILFILYKRDWLDATLSSQNISFHVIFFCAGFLFGLGFIWVLKAPPNKSLDASGDGMFRIIKDAAKVE